MTNQNDQAEFVEDWGSASSNSRRPTATALLITKENKWVYLIAVCALAVTAVGTLVGIIILSYQNKEIPGALIALGSASIGALSGLFARS